MLLVALAELGQEARPLERVEVDVDRSDPRSIDGLHAGDRLDAPRRASPQRRVLVGAEVPRHPADLGSAVRVQERMAVAEERPEEVARARTSRRSCGP